MAEVTTRSNFRGRRSFVDFDANAGSVKQQRKYGYNPAFQPERAEFCPNASWGHECGSSNSNYVIAPQRGDAGGGVRGGAAS